MTTPNLAITHILQSQAQKEVTANDAFDALDNSANRALSLDLGDADLTLVAGQANRNGLIIFTGTLTAARTVTLPANHRRLAVRNATTGGFAVTFTYPGAGANVAVLPDTTALLQGDGIDLFGVAGGGNGGGTLDDLDDVNTASAINGDLLSFDGSLWRPDAGGTHTRIPLPFKGALLGRTTDQTIVNQTSTDVVWQAADYDTDGFWSGSGSANLIIPNGITKVGLTASVRWENISTGDRECWFSKNGSAFNGNSHHRQNSQFWRTLKLTSSILPVVAGDVFKLHVWHDRGSNTSITAGPYTWMALEVVETEEAANLPYDFPWRKEGQPGASEVVFRQVLARRVRLEADFAGSVGLAGTAATADADFDVRQNGSSIGTIRFGAGATAPTFIATAAVTLEIGDELTVVAPAGVDASLSDPATSVSGSLIS